MLNADYKTISVFERIAWLEEWTLNWLLVCDFILLCIYDVLRYYCSFD